MLHKRYWLLKYLHFSFWKSQINIVVDLFIIYKSNKKYIYSMPNIVTYKKSISFANKKKKKKHGLILVFEGSNISFLKVKSKY